jgi:hypothetical protein
MGLESGIRDPGSGKNLFRISDQGPGFKKASVPGSATLLFSRIRTWSNLQLPGSDCLAHLVGDEAEPLVVQLVRLEDVDGLQLLLLPGGELLATALFPLQRGRAHRRLVRVPQPQSKQGKRLQEVLSTT